MKHLFVLLSFAFIFPMLNAQDEASMNWVLGGSLNFSISEEDNHFIAHSQNAQPYKNEIGISLVKVHKIKSPHKQYHDKKQPIHFLNGIQYKRRFKHSALRFEIGYTAHRENSLGNYFLSHGESDYQFTSFSLGYEKQISSGKLIPYWALDGSFSNETYSQFSELDHWSHSRGTQNSTRNTYALAPIFGLRYYFFNRFSLTMETSLKLYYSRLSTHMENTQLIGTTDEFTRRSHDRKEDTGVQYIPIHGFRLSYIF